MKPTPLEFKEGLASATSKAEKFLIKQKVCKQGTVEFICAVTLLTQVLLAKDHPRILAALVGPTILWRRVQLGTNVDIDWGGVRNLRRTTGWGTAPAKPKEDANNMFGNIKAVFEWRRVVNEYEAVLRRGKDWATEPALVSSGGQPATAINNTLGGGELLQLHRCAWLSTFTRMLGAGSFAVGDHHRQISYDFLIAKKATSSASVNKFWEGKTGSQKAAQAIPKIVNAAQYPIKSVSAPWQPGLHSRFWQHHECAGVFGLMWPPPANKFETWKDLIAALVVKSDESATLEADALSAKVASGAALKVLQEKLLNARGEVHQRNALFWQLTRAVQYRTTNHGGFEGFVLELSPPTLSLQTKADEDFNRKTWQATKNMGPWLRFFGRTIALWYRFLAEGTRPDGTPFLSSMQRLTYRPRLIIRFGSEVNLGFKTLANQGEGQPYGVDVTVDPSGKVASTLQPTAAGYADAAQFAYARILEGADEVLKEPKEGPPKEKGGTDPGWPYKASNVIKLAVVVNGTSRLLKVTSSGKPVEVTYNGKKAWASKWCVAGEHGEVPLLLPPKLAQQCTYVGADIYGWVNHSKVSTGPHAGQYQEVVAPTLRSPFDSAAVFEHLEKVAPGKHWLIAETGFGALPKGEWDALSKACGNKLLGSWKPVGGTPCADKQADPPMLLHYVRAWWLRAFFVAVRAKYMDLFPAQMSKLLTVHDYDADGIPTFATFDIKKIRQLVLLPFNINKSQGEGQDFSLVHTWQPAANSKKPPFAVGVATSPGQDLAAAQEAMRRIYESKDWNVVVDWPSVISDKTAVKDTDSWTKAAKEVAQALFGQKSP